WQSSQMDTVPSLDIAVYREKGVELLNYIYDRGVISLVNRYQTKGEDPEKINPTETNYNFTLLNDNVAQQKNTVDCFTIETADNYLHNEHLTEKVEQTAIANISTTRGMVQKGELIAEKDKIVNNETYQKLQSLKQVFEDESRISGDRNYVIFGQFLLVGLAMTL